VQNPTGPFHPTITLDPNEQILPGVADGHLDAGAARRRTPRAA
jgi:hypothetical protein